MEDLKSCPNECHIYKVKMKDIIEAADKHRDAATNLKEIVHRQKIKISEYREGMERLELSLKECDRYNYVVVTGNKELEEEVKLLKQKLSEKIKEEYVREEVYDTEIENQKKRLNNWKKMFKLDMKWFKEDVTKSEH